MISRPRFLLALLGTGLALSAATPTATVAPATPLHVLYFTKSAGFEHSFIQRVDSHRNREAKMLPLPKP